MVVVGTGILPIVLVVSIGEERYIASGVGKTYSADLSVWHSVFEDEAKRSEIRC